MAHIHEKIDFIAEVFVVHGGAVLLRRHEKYRIWIGVGGHVELDEDPIEAAVREVKEEVGLDVILVDTRICKVEEPGQRELIPPIGVNRHKVTDTHEHVALYYVATSKTDNVIPENKDDEWKWCREKDIDQLDNVPANTRCYAKEALRLVGGER